MTVLGDGFGRGREGIISSLSSILSSSSPSLILPHFFSSSSCSSTNASSFSLSRAEEAPLASLFFLHDFSLHVTSSSTFFVCSNEPTSSSSSSFRHYPLCGIAFLSFSLAVLLTILPPPPLSSPPSAILSLTGESCGRKKISSVHYAYDFLFSSSSSSSF